MTNLHQSDQALFCQKAVLCERRRCFLHALASLCACCERLVNPREKRWPAPPWSPVDHRQLKRVDLLLSTGAIGEKKRAVGQAEPLQVPWWLAFHTSPVPDLRSENVPRPILSAEQSGWSPEERTVAR